MCGVCICGALIWHKRVSREPSEPKLTFWKEKTYKISEQIPVQEKIVIIGVLLETPMDFSLETRPRFSLETGPYFHWTLPDFHCRPSKKKYKERRRKGAPLIMSRSS